VVLMQACSLLLARLTPVGIVQVDIYREIC
jgi:hypothetical protein